MAAWQRPTAKKSATSVLNPGRTSPLFRATAASHRQPWHAIHRRAIPMKGKPHAAVHPERCSHDRARVEREDIGSIALGALHALVHERCPDTLLSVFWVNGEHADNRPCTIKEWRLWPMRCNVRNGTHNVSQGFCNN